MVGELGEEDRKRVAEYRKTLDKYPRPSVTADIIAVRPVLYDAADGNWRTNQKFAIELLLIRRGEWPHKGYWALPGGFIRPTESVEEGARRELKEETALDAHPLIPVGTFSKPGRDMRAWIISNAFVSVYRAGEGCHVKGGDDAEQARWMRIELPLVGTPLLDGSGLLGFSLPFRDGDQELFTLRGVYRPSVFGGGEVVQVDPNPLAFDHAEIIATAFLRMLSFDVRELVFFFLPDKFTLSNYIDVYQYLTRNSVDPVNIPNFRRQLTATKDPLLEVCPGEFADLEGRGHAPAKLYRRRADAREATSAGAAPSAWGG